MRRSMADAGSGAVRGPRAGAAGAARVNNLFMETSA